MLLLDTHFQRQNRLREKLALDSENAWKVCSVMYVLSILRRAIWSWKLNLSIVLMLLFSVIKWYLYNLFIDGKFQFSMFKNIYAN